MVLYDRGFSYYVVINVPSELIPIFKKRQIWRSLHTKDKKVALMRSLPIISRMNSIFLREQQMNSLRGFNKNDDLDIDLDLPTTRSPEPFDYDDGGIEELALDFCIEQISKDKLTLIKNIDTLNYYHQLLQEYISQYHLQNFANMAYYVDAYITSHRLQKPTESCRNAFLRSFMLAFIQYLEAMIDYIKGANVAFPTHLMTTPPLINSSLVVTQSYNLPNKVFKNKNLPLTELAVIYNNEASRNNVSTAQKERINARVKVLSALLEDKPILEITSDDLQELVYSIQWLPLRLGKNFSANDLRGIVNSNKGHPENSISCKTRNDYVQTLKSLFVWALKRKYISENPLDEIDIPAPPKTMSNEKYIPFTIHQLKILFNSQLFSRHWDDNPQKRSLFWIILLGCFSGMRLNEICQLQFDDILEEDGIYYISINDNDGKRVKTKAGIRRTPLHHELLKIGFLAFVQKMKKINPKGNKRIFFTLIPNVRGEYSAQPSKWFRKLLESLKIKEDKLVFHSFRHTVRTILRNNNCPIDRVQLICGWEGEKSLSEHYGSISIKVLADELNGKLVYEGLDLSHLYIKKVSMS